MREKTKSLARCVTHQTHEHISIDRHTCLLLLCASRLLSSMLILLSLALSVNIIGLLFAAFLSHCRPIIIESSSLARASIYPHPFPSIDRQPPPPLKRSLWRRRRCGVLRGVAITRSSSQTIDQSTFGIDVMNNYN